MINPNYKVGVSTDTPTATLQVSGSFVVSTSAQTTTPSLYVGTNGNVGVGTSSPGYNMELAGPNVAFALTNTASSNKNWRFRLNSNNLDVVETGATTRMTLQSGGNVGIGTTAPTKTLDVSGTANITSNTTISGTLQVAGTDDATCNGAADYGKIRFNPTTGSLDICR